MKKTTILLAIVCSMFVGLSMAVTFHILNGGRSSSTAQGNAAGAATHDMPPGMSHEEHLKMMAEAEAKKQAASVGDKPMSHDHHPGQEDSSDPRPQFRSIKSLTADEIKAYEEGTGHGMAKAAEQNHYPGPRHVLDLSKELKLSAE